MSEEIVESFDITIRAWRKEMIDCGECYIKRRTMVKSAFARRREREWAA